MGSWHVDVVLDFLYGMWHPTKIEETRIILASYLFIYSYLVILNYSTFMNHDNYDGYTLQAMAWLGLGYSVSVTLRCHSVV